MTYFDHINPFVTTWFTGMNLAYFSRNPPLLRIIDPPTSRRRFVSSLSLCSNHREHHSAASSNSFFLPLRSHLSVFIISRSRPDLLKTRCDFFLWSQENANALGLSSESGWCCGPRALMCAYYTYPSTRGTKAMGWNNTKEHPVFATIVSFFFLSIKTILQTFSNVKYMNDNAF